MIMTSAVEARIHAVAPVSKTIICSPSLSFDLHAEDLMKVPMLSDSCRMKNPVVLFVILLLLLNNFAKLSQEGSCIPIIINISIVEKISAVA
jgi:hypothetical protein